jgi:hypothetical protein
MYSKGISWIDDCRIPFVDGDKTVNHNTVPGSFVGSVGYSEKIYHENTTGRFPANLLVSDDMLNDGNVSSIKQNKDYIPPNEANSIHNYSRGKYSGIQDKGTNSRYYDIDKWFDNLIDV